MAVEDVRNRREARLQGLNQDVLAVPASQPTAPVAPTVSSLSAPAGERSARQNMPTPWQWLTLLLAVVALVAAGFALWQQQQQQRRADQEGTLASTWEERLIRQEQQVLEMQQALATVRQELESLLSAAPAAAQAVPAAMPANAQLSARLRKAELELEQLTARLSTSQDMPSQHQQLRQQVLAQGERLAEVTRQLADTRQLLEGTSQQESLQALEARLDRATTDIRSLYRMLELGR